jgi:hypothetical protein
MSSTSSTAPVTTAPSAQSAFTHVFSNVFPNDVAQIKDFFEYYGILDMDDFLTLDDSDFNTQYSTPAAPTLYQILTPLLSKRLGYLQHWYAPQPNQDYSTWFDLTAPNDFRQRCVSHNAQRCNPPATPSIVSSSAVPSVPSFRTSMKVNIADYIKLKDDSQWRVFNRQLRAAAASHDTLEVLDPLFLPPTGHEYTFEQKCKFMYNMFSHCILTSKGKVFVPAQEKSLNGQLVYEALQKVYDDQLSAQLDATNIRSELTIMKHDDKWRKSYETFLSHWISRVQELESIEDKDVDDDTKGIWLTNTLQSHKEMNNAIRQAVTTEITLSGINGTAAQLSWDHF